MGCARCATPKPRSLSTPLSSEIATTVAAGYEANGGLFVTVQDTGGDFGLFRERRPRLAGRVLRAGQDRRAGMAQGRRARHRPGRIKLAPEAVADLLADELLHGGADREIGLTADGGRYAFVSTEKRPAAAPPVVTPDWRSSSFPAAGAA
jgi:hypothetical protein